MNTNTTKAKLIAGETVIGCFIRYPDAGLVELMGYMGWDFFVFDGEHGYLEPHDCEHMVRAAEVRGITPLVRVTTNQPHIILRFLDTGAQGGHVPWLNSADEVEAAVQSFKYYPRGKRGLAGVRAAGYGQDVPLPEYIKQANEQTLVVIHIETANAVEQIDAFVNIDSVDVIFIGPTDLSHSLGYPGQPEHPVVQKAIDRVIDTVNETELALGVYTGSASQAREWKERGVRYIATGIEGLLKTSSRDFLEAIRRE